MAHRSGYRKVQATSKQTPQEQTQIQPHSRSFATPPPQVQSEVEEPKAESAQQAAQYNALNLPIHAIGGTSSGGMPIMPKLTIGAVGDKYEQEADAVAAQVVQQINSPAPAQNINQGENTQGGALSMKLLEGSIQCMEEEEDELRAKSIVQLQRFSSGGVATPDLEDSIQQLRGKGESLSNSIRQPMEQAFGADFSRVKIHTDSQSDQLNQSIQAKAFTTGQDIFFRQGAYNPISRDGQELLAHELTHTVQQNPINRQVNPLQQTASPKQISRTANPGVQRRYLDDRKLFYTDTELGTFYRRGALEPVDVALKDYEQTILVPESEDPTLANKREHVDEKLKKLFRLKDVVEFWVFQHFDLKDATTAKQTRIVPTLELQDEVTAAIKQQVKVYNQLTGTEGSEQDVEEQLRSDSMDSALKSRVATLIDAIVQPGTLSKLSAALSLAIDVQPPGYVGFDLGLDVERKENDVVNVRAELAATGGVRVPKVFDVKAKLGGYVEAEAADSRKVMNLLSYGLYRKFVEAKLMPASAAGVIWGGSFSESGQIMAAKWAADVERGVFGAQGGEEAYVDLGLLAGVGVEVGDTETLGGGIEYKYTTGQKYTKESVERAGGLGQVTKEDVGNKGNKKKGEGSSAHKFTGTLSAGIFKGKLEYTKSGASQEIAGSAQFSGIPDFVSFLLGVEGTVSNFKSAYEKKDKSKQASDTVQGFDSLVGTLQLLANDGAAIQAVPSTSTKGEIAFKASKSGTEKWVVEIMLNQITSAPIPSDLGVVKLEVEKSDTRFKVSNKGGTWQVIEPRKKSENP